MDNVVLIVNQLANKYEIKQVLLFGSQAKGAAVEKSDIDLCVIIDTDNKRKLLTDMYVSMESAKPFDLLLYTPDEWNNCINDKSSFAYYINKNGIVVYGS